MKRTYKQHFVDFVSNVNPLIVVFVMCVAFSILTFIIPGGEFVRKVVEIAGVKRELVVPGSYHHVPSIPQGFAQTWTLFVRGALEGADRIFVIFLAAGALTAIISTNAITAGLHILIKKTGRFGLAFIPIIVFAFGTCGATFGMYDECVPFILVLTPLMISLGFDSMVAVFILYWSVPIGFACGITNPYNVAIGQAIANVPIYSGTWYRVICFFVFMTIVSTAITYYAWKVKKNPKKSLSFIEDCDKQIAEHKSEVNPEDSAMTKRRAVALVLLAIGFIILIYGLMRYGWGFHEIASVFFWMGIVIPIVGGLKITEMIEKNIEGMRSVMIAVIMMGMAQGMFFILNDSRILDTILNFFVSYLGHVNDIIISYIMFIISAIMAAMIGSASGTAAAIMPILAPLADVLGFSKQIVVLAFQFATGAFNFWMPWDALAFTICTMAGVNFFKYLKVTAKFAMFIYFPTALILLTIAVLIKLT